MSLRCAVRGCDKEAEARDRLEMKRINQEADEALRERAWQSRARVQRREHEQNSCGDRQTERLLGMVHQCIEWFTGRQAAGHVRLKGE